MRFFALLISYWSLVIIFLFSLYLVLKEAEDKARQQRLAVGDELNSRSFVKFYIKAILGERIFSSKYGYHVLVVNLALWFSLLGLFILPFFF